MRAHLVLTALAWMLAIWCHELAVAANGAKRPRGVVVLAQGRSGSSFISSWFGAHPNVTYFIEPCSLTYVLNAARDKTGSGCAKVLDSLSRCDFSQVALDRNMSEFIPDVAKGFKGWGHQRGDEDVEHCKDRLATVVKELRVGMAWAEGKVKFEKAIVLLRDPRAVVNSRTKDWPPRNKKLNDWVAEPFGWDGKRGFPYDQSLKSLCLEHVKLRERVKASAEGEALLVEYQEVLDDPEKLLERVMAFAELQLVPETAAFVRKNTKGECEHPDKPFSVCRSKLPRKDAKWRKTLSKDQEDEIMATPECVEVIEKHYPDDKDHDEL